MRKPLRITGRDNQHLKFARRVRDRKETDFIIIEGKRMCGEAVSSGVRVEMAFLSDTYQASEFEVLDFGEDVPAFVVTNTLFSSIADTDSPQGIILIARRPEKRKIDGLLDVTGGIPLWVCAESLNNPSNLGALIRTAEAAGARGLFLTANSADPYAPKSLRSSMGSAFRLPIAATENTAEIFGAAKSRGLSIAAMDASGSLEYMELNWTKPTLLVVGSEAHGISKTTAEQADHLIRIEMKKPVESLNLAVSAAVVLFEAARQNRLPDRQVR
jgi:TrmH family RNA methyltransferase